MSFEANPNWDNQALALNETLYKANPASYTLLAERGKAIYFPKLGILSQSAEAKSTQINATIGIANEDSGKPMYLESVAKHTSVEPAKTFPYAPSPGLPELRDLWKAKQLEANPSLKSKTYSNPLVTHALTHALSIAGYLFAEEGSTLISPNYYWENYDLTFGISYGSQMKTFETFTSEGGFNVSGLQKTLQNTKGKRIVVLNFPNNPTGYTPTTEEARDIAKVLTEAAQSAPLIVIIDDAYFGLCFDDKAYKESIFSLLCDAHENLLAVKIDGATKEDYVWGLRVGFLSFGIKNGSPALYAALEGKAGGAIRGTISNASNLSQSMLVKAFSDPMYQAQKKEKFQILKSRFDEVLRILKSHPEFSEAFSPLPFNSGYFMCVEIKEKSAEAIRQHLIKNYSTGIIVFGKLIRVAFSSTPLPNLEQAFLNIYKAWKEV